MKRKVVISFLLTMVLLVSFGISVQASIMDVAQGEPIDQQIVMIDGVPVVFEVFDDNGIITEVARIEESMMRGSMDDVDRSQLLEGIRTVADEISADVHSRFVQSQQVMQAQESQALNLARAPTIMYQQHNNSAQGTGVQGNRDTLAGHWTTARYEILGFPTFMRAFNGASRAMWIGSGNADSFEIIDTISRTGIQVSVSFPAGFSVNSASSSASRQAHIRQPGTMATLHRPDFSANTIVNFGSLVRVETEARAHRTNTVFVAVVRSNW